MLRHYDEIGILIPEQVDPFTGYRYYREEQLPAANRILSLKGMGFGLKEIKQILMEKPDETEIKLFLEQKANQKTNEIRLLESQLQRIRNTLGKTVAENEFAGCIAIKEIPKRRIVSFRAKLAEYSQEGFLWKTLYDECRKQNVSFSNMEYNIAVLHGVDPENNEIDVEVQKTINCGSDSGGILEFKTVEAVTVASLVFRGGYCRLEAVNEAVAKWIRENNYELNGNLFNIYHVSPENSEIESGFVTEVCFPVRPAHPGFLQESATL